MTNLISISKARATLPELIKRVNKYDDRVLITVGGKPKAILMSPEEVESWEETLEILSIPGALESIREGLEDIKKGRYITFEELKKKHELKKVINV